jgi:hypothetical protein
LGTEVFAADVSGADADPALVSCAASPEDNAKTRRRYKEREEPVILRDRDRGRDPTRFGQTFVLVRRMQTICSLTCDGMPGRRAWLISLLRGT